MKICVAQTRPVAGDVEANIAGHLRLIDQAIGEGAGLIVFPELSITGYEPTLAAQLAMNADDQRLKEFGRISIAEGIVIGIGAPLKGDDGVRIGMIIFGGATREVYCKQYLHADEEAYFVCGSGQTYLEAEGEKIGLSICYELSVPEHAERVHLGGAGIYLSSVAKSAAGLVKAGETLAGTAQKYGMTVLLSSCIGNCDNFEGGGRSAVWNKEGVLLGQMDDAREGILIYDTSTEDVIERHL
jgi:predicted amidohydrolase